MFENKQMLMMLLLRERRGNMGGGWGCQQAGPASCATIVGCSEFDQWGKCRPE